MNGSRKRDSSHSVYGHRYNSRDANKSRYTINSRSASNGKDTSNSRDENPHISLFKKCIDDIAFDSIKIL
jgi:hypothetical protein